MKLSEEEVYCKKTGRYVTVYKFNCMKKFNPRDTFAKETVEKAFNFAYGMTFGADGHHRSYRTGGIERRNNRQIFADTFQGKLGKFALYNTLRKEGLTVEEPDVSMYGKGIWAHSNLDYKNFKISIKSTKSFGQLMLLEAAGWTKDGLYTPNIGTGNELYHFFILVRIKPYATDLIKPRKNYETNEVKTTLKKDFFQKKFTYDIPGCISRKTLIEIIKRSYIIKQ